MSKIKKLFLDFLVWRSHKISDDYFVLILSVIVGIGAGFIALALKSSVSFLHKFVLEDLSFNNDNIVFLIAPAIGIIIVVLFKKLILRDFERHSVSSILYSISKHNSIMKIHKIFSSVVGGIITAGFGGSIGLESPIISSGSAFGSNLGKVLNLDYKRITLLLACGAAGGISAIFSTPIAGIVFAIEVLMLDLTRFSLIPLLAASVSGTIITSIFDKAVLFEFTLVEKFATQDLIFYILLGLITGLISVYFTKVYLSIEERLDNVKSHTKKILIGGVSLGLIILLFPPLYGEGYDTIKYVLSGNTEALSNRSYILSFFPTDLSFILFLVMLVFFKVIATAITVGSGGVGGIFAPSLYTGAISGFIFAKLTNMSGIAHVLSESNFALVGMAGVLSGVLTAPLTAMFLIAEITSGYGLIVPLMIASTISFVTVKYFNSNSIFTTQLAKTGDLITHHKDKAALSFMKLQEVIETDLKTVDIDATLGDLVEAIAVSKRNIFPIINRDNELLGIVPVDLVREIMFNTEMYDSTYVRNLMVLPPAYIYSEDKMNSVMDKFNNTNAWNLPVIENGKYVGFVSKSKLFSAYRKLIIDISTE